MSEKASQTPGWVYMIREREFTAQEPTHTKCKIGRTRGFTSRSQSYPRNSEVVVVLPCDSMLDAENAIKRAFDSQGFRCCKEVGSETFEGDRDAMAWTMVAAVLQQRLIQRPSNNDIVMFGEGPLAPPKRITVTTFISDRLRRHTAPAFLTLKEAYRAYVIFCSDGKAAPEKKGEFKTEMLVELGPFSLPSGSKKNYWRGWGLVDATTATTTHVVGSSAIGDVAAADN